MKKNGRENSVGYEVIHDMFETKIYHIIEHRIMDGMYQFVKITTVTADSAEQALTKLQEQNNET